MSVSVSAQGMYRQGGGPRTATSQKLVGHHQPYVMGSEMNVRESVRVLVVQAPGTSVFGVVIVARGVASRVLLDELENAT